MSMIRFLSERENVQNKELKLWEHLEQIYTEPEQYSVDFDIMKGVLNDLIINKVSDAILYTRLSQRLLVIADEMEPEKDDTEICEDIDDLVAISKILEEHAEEEFSFFQNTLSLSMTLNIACGLDFSFLPPAAGMKFQELRDMIDFVQHRELTSLFKFYMLWQAMVSTCYLADLDEEEQLHYINMIKDIIEQEIEHFEDLQRYSDVGTDKFTLSKVEHIKQHMQKEL